MPKVTVKFTQKITFHVPVTVTKKELESLEEMQGDELTEDDHSNLFSKVTAAGHPDRILDAEDKIEIEEVEEE